MFKDKVFKPQVVDKGWGMELIPANSDKNYCGKILVFHKGKKLSWHVHHIKDEIFYLLKGRLILRVAEHDDLTTAEEFILEQGECFHVYPGLRHQMEALEASELMESSTMHIESDSIRIIKGD